MFWNDGCWLLKCLLEQNQAWILSPTEASLQRLKLPSPGAGSGHASCQTEEGLRGPTDLEG